MPQATTEWEFTAQVKSWIDQAIANHRELPFSEARCEQRGSGSHKRRDLTLLDKSGKAVLTGEVKLPYRKDGNTPYRSEVVQDARVKARLAGVSYFFTWNVNEFVLWETAAAGMGLPEQTFERWKVTNVSREEHMDQPPTVDAICRWLAGFLNDFAKILRGRIKIGQRSPDQKFVEALESALALPIRHTEDALFSRYRSASFERDLDTWMRGQGWVILDDVEGVRENLERAAKFACYLLVNKLVFHEALLKRYGEAMDPLNAPPEVTTGEELRMRLEGFFSDAKRATGDYETIFGEGHRSIGNRIPFYSDAAVVSWRGLIEQIHEFDFSRLDYEVIGNIFERLIGPEERKKYGQFYTRVEVVDLINSFCIATGEDKVLDPACGGGTFLVRAYGRKRELAPHRKHRDLIADIYGVDLSQFAANLTTMNLATRDLVDEENYPRVGREDFFSVLPDSPFIHLPQKLVSKGLGKNTLRPVSIPQLDAVIANPPYVRQEEIRKAKVSPKDGGPEPGTKEFYAKQVKKLAQADLSGRSDLHCYFWPHAAQFLKEDGMLGFITSSQWLDVEYGFKLQKWLLSNFEILAVMESICEPWFVGARVATAVAIARRCNDDERRMANKVRFIQLRVPLGEILDHDGTMAGAVGATDSLRDEILRVAENVSNRRYRARLVNQRDLWREGVKLGQIMRANESQDEETEEGTADIQSGDYYGGKWGVYLRAPDLWFELLDTRGDRFTPLGALAEIRYGVKSGKDAFFYPRDCSQDCLTRIAEPITFEHEYGAPRELVDAGEVKLVLCGASDNEKREQIKPIEAKYLEPEVHSLMGIDRPAVTARDTKYLILLVPSGRRLDRYAKAYIAWGQEIGIHKTKTCAARVTEEKDWYDLTGRKRAPVLWPKEKQYRHIAPANEDGLIANCRLYEVYPLIGESDPDLWGGLLNSTIVLASSFQYGRPMGNEGNWSTMVVDVNMMVVPNVCAASSLAKERIRTVFRKLKQRTSLQFLSEQRMRRMAYARADKTHELEHLSEVCELDMSDRRALDHAVFELLGVKSTRERDEWINRLYDYLREFFEQVRQKEEQAIVNKNTAKRKGSASPQDIASQIWRDLSENEARWLRPYREFLREVIGRDGRFNDVELPRDGHPALHTDMLTRGVLFTKNKKQVEFVQTETQDQAELLVLIAQQGLRDIVRIPSEKEACSVVLANYTHFLRELDVRLRELVAERTSDEDLQHKALELLTDRVKRTVI